MACLHKFHNHLQLAQLGFEPTTLIVGTFNPEWPENNTAQWFYGRTESNYLWHVLPGVYGEASLMNAAPVEWRQFCRDKKIAFTDLISSIDDADPHNNDHHKILGGFSDKAIAHNFDDFVFVNIVQLLQRHATIRNIYFTKAVTELFWRHLWNPVTHYCNHNQLYERKVLTPTIDAAYQHGAYNLEHPANVIPLLEDYILMRWKEVWHV